MSETAEIYQRVIAKCPAAKVEGLWPVDQNGKRRWQHDDARCSCGNAQDWTLFDDPIAESIIVGEWLKLLPCGHGLFLLASGYDRLQQPYSHGNKYEKWAVCSMDQGGNWSEGEGGPTKLLALASYLERLP